MLTTKDFEWRFGVLTLEECLPLIQRQYGIKTSVKKIQALLRYCSVVDIYNTPFSPYDELGYFDSNKQHIHSPYGRKVARNYKLLLTKDGFTFLVEFLNTHFVIMDKNHVEQ